MAEELIIPEVSFTSEENPTYGYCCMTSAPFTFVVGAQYRIIWDSAEYRCVGMDASAIEDGAVLVGNGEPFGFSGKGEPFAMGTLGSGTLMILCLTDTQQTSHTVSVYEGTDAAPGIVLRDHNGEAETYGFPARLRVDTTGGGTIHYLHEGQLPAQVEKTVELDFSGGTMAVTPEEGQTFSKVTIPVPETLIPEYIAEGVDIAGIVGTLAAGSGIGQIVFATGDFTPTASGHTISHDLGVVPDVAAVFEKLDTAPPSSDNYRIAMCVNFSSKIFAANPDVRGFLTSKASGVTITSANSLESDNQYYGVLLGADETQMRIGGGSETLYKLKTGVAYRWFALGGLV